jgi:hypothetical protein
MRERLVAADCTLAVAARERERETGARGRERLEAEAGQDARGADVPGVGDHERARALVQRAEGARSFNLARFH